MREHPDPQSRIIKANLPIFKKSLTSCVLASIITLGFQCISHFLVPFFFPFVI